MKFKAVERNPEIKMEMRFFEITSGARNGPDKFLCYFFQRNSSAFADGRHTEGHGHQEINEITLQRKKKGSQITSVKSSEGKRW